MKLSAKTEYALLALLELAAHADSAEPVRIRSIADRHRIPQRFLVQILLQLKGAGLVSSSRGAAGGYRLVKQPEEISLADVVDIIEGPQEIESNTPTKSAAAHVLLQTWQEIHQVQRAMLEETTLAELVESMQESAGDMYYI